MSRSDQNPGRRGGPGPLRPLAPGPAPHRGPRAPVLPASAFLPLHPADLAARGWKELDVLLVSGDAYVDHPSFGVAVIGWVLEA